MGDIVRRVDAKGRVQYYIRYRDNDGRRKQRASRQPESAAPPAQAPAPTELPEDALVQETRMLARARALVTSSPAAARQALEAYDARFPQGQLHRELAAIERALASANPQ